MNICTLFKVMQVWSAAVVSRAIFFWSGNWSIAAFMWRCCSRLSRLLTITDRRRKGSQIFKQHCTWSHTCSVKLDDMFTVYAMEQPGVVAGNFDLSFSLNFMNIFVHISGFITPITLIWTSLERPFPPAEVEYRWCQFWSKVMTSEVEERTRLVTAGHGRHKSQWVKQTTTTTAPTTSPNKRFNEQTNSCARAL